MIRVFYGENRVAAEKEIRRVLGEDYETVEGAELTPEDLVNLMLGQTLFARERKILVRDLLANKAAAADLVRYVETPHEVVLWEMKVDKRSSVYKELKDKIEWREFAMPRDVNAGVVFDVYKVAKRDGRRAVEMLRRIEGEQEPMMFAGLMASQALRDYKARPGVKEKRALKELSKLDMLLKTGSRLQPWVLIESFLLRLGA